MADAGFQAGAIFVALRATVDDFQRNLKSAIDGLKSFGSQVGSIAGKIANFGRQLGSAMLAPVRAVSSLISSLTGLKTIIFALVASQAFNKLAIEPAKAAIELERLADRAGISAEKLGLLQFVVQSFGGQPEDVAQGLAKLNQKIFEAQQGSEEAQAALQALGGQFQTLDEAISAIFANPNLNAAALRKSGIAEFAVLAGKSKAEVDGLIRKFVELHGVADGELLGLGRRFAKVTTELQAALGFIAESISKVILPRVLDLAQAFSDFVARNGPEIEALFQVAQQEVERLFEAVRQLSDRPGQLLNALRRATEELFKGIAKQAEVLFRFIFEGGVEGVKALFVTLSAIIGPGLVTLGQAVFEHVGAIFEKLKSRVEIFLGILVDLALQSLAGLFNSVAQKFALFLRQLGVTIRLAGGQLGELLGAGRLGDELDALADKVKGTAAAVTALAGNSAQTITQALAKAVEADKQIDKQVADSISQFQDQFSKDAEKLVRQQGDVAAESANKFRLAMVKAAKDAGEAALRTFKVIGDIFGAGVSLPGRVTFEQFVAQNKAEIDRQLQQAQNDLGKGEQTKPKPRLSPDQQAAIDRQIESFTGSLTSAIGTAITDGVLEGKKAMETLADVGAQLFRDFTGNAMKDLQTGLTSAMKAVFGSDEIAGAFSGLFSAVLGIAGGVLSVLQRKRSSSRSFNPVTGTVESTQPLRGIVAGPANVAIAAVGENLQRALLPTNDILRSIHSTLLAIAGKKGGGFSGFGYAGAVSTT